VCDNAASAECQTNQHPGLLRSVPLSRENQAVACPSPIQWRVFSCLPMMLLFVVTRMSNTIRNSVENRCSRYDDGPESCCNAAT
jgi:hypothetical protein